MFAELYTFVRDFKSLPRENILIIIDDNYIKRLNFSDNIVLNAGFIDQLQNMQQKLQKTSSKME